MTHAQVLKLADKLGGVFWAQEKLLAVAESCTGGLLAAILTEIPGSSLWFDRGFVTYSNQAKSEMLGVDPNIIAEYGAVSSATALAMVSGAIVHSHADYAVAITGIAGPGGGTQDKPVGTVYIAWQARNAQGYCELQHFTGDRQSVRLHTVNRALEYLMTHLVGK